MEHARLGEIVDVGRKTGKRADVSLACEVRQGTRSWTSSCLEDMSQAGFRISSYPGASADRELKIRIPGLQILNAFVRWQNGDQIGCEFETPLHVAVFEHIVRQAHQR